MRLIKHSFQVNFGFDDRTEERTSGREREDRERRSGPPGERVDRKRAETAHDARRCAFTGDEFIVITPMEQ